MNADLTGSAEIKRIIVDDNTKTTDDTVELKTAEAIVHKLKRDHIDELRKLPTSLMPADLQKQLQAQDLVDIVEYLTTLKKPG